MCYFCKAVFLMLIHSVCHDITCCFAALAIVPAPWTDHQRRTLPIAATNLDRLAASRNMGGYRPSKPQGRTTHPTHHPGYAIIYARGIIFVLIRKIRFSR